MQESSDISKHEAALSAILEKRYSKGVILLEIE